MNWTVLGLTLVCAASQATAQNTYTINNSTADAFLTATNPTLNYGAAGTLAIAPASSAKGEFDSVLLFNTASAVSQFNSAYGLGDWTITGLTLYFYAADNQVSYLFDSRNYTTGHPELTLTVEPTPEPATTALLAASLGGFLCLRWRTLKK